MKTLQLFFFACWAIVALYLSFSIIRRLAWQQAWCQLTRRHRAAVLETTQMPAGVNLGIRCLDCGYRSHGVTFAFKPLEEVADVPLPVEVQEFLQQQEVMERAVDGRVGKC